MLLDNRYLWFALLPAGWLTMSQLLDDTNVLLNVND